MGLAERPLKTRRNLMKEVKSEPRCGGPHTFLPVWGHEHIVCTAGSTGESSS